MAHHVPALCVTSARSCHSCTHLGAALQFLAIASAAFCLAWLAAFWGRGCPQPPLQGGKAQVVHQVPGVAFACKGWAHFAQVLGARSCLATHAAAHAGLGCCTVVHQVGHTDGFVCNCCTNPVLPLLSLGRQHTSCNVLFGVLWFFFFVLISSGLKSSRLFVLIFLPDITLAAGEGNFGTLRTVAGLVGWQGLAICAGIHCLGLPLGCRAALLRFTPGA